MIKVYLIERGVCAGKNYVLIANVGSICRNAHDTSPHTKEQGNDPRP
ncbi:MAG: hypothetical protein FWF78_05260 [Defluviitaleaceae bacterium]|nr:hypothetical protein [Defluviitaleaceae bacterium]